MLGLLPPGHALLVMIINPLIPSPFHLIFRNDVLVGVMRKLLSHEVHERVIVITQDPLANLHRYLFVFLVLDLLRLDA